MDQVETQGLGERVAIAAIRFYQWTLSPFFAGSCRFVPSCSEYAVLAIRKDGVWRGSGRAVGRILRCQPFGPGGFDFP